MTIAPLSIFFLNGLFWIWYETASDGEAPILENAGLLFGYLHLSRPRFSGFGYLRVKMKFSWDIGVLMGVKGLTCNFIRNCNVEMGILQLEFKLLGFMYILDSSTHTRHLCSKGYNMTRWCWKILSLTKKNIIFNFIYLFF